MIDVLLVDDEPLARSGLRAILGCEPDIDVVGEAGDGVEAVASVRERDVDVVLMDVRMPRIDGITATRQLTAREAGPAVVVVTTFENDDYVYEALLAGAQGFLLKRAPAEDFVHAVRTAHRRESLLFPSAIRDLVLAQRRGTGDSGTVPALTDREAEVLRLVARGMTNAEIASELFVTAETVKTHVGNVLAKLGARDRVQAVIWAYDSGFLLGSES